MFIKLRRKNDKIAELELPEKITSEAEARQYITLLTYNNLSYHPDDPASECFEYRHWDPEAYEKMDQLMDDIRNLGLDPSELFCEIEAVYFSNND